MTDIQNRGIHLLNHVPNASESKKTFVIMGVARSGTSMAAIVLHHLGVNMGVGKDDVIYERPDVYHKLEKKRQGLFRRFVENQNITYPLWGWKRPKSIEYVSRFESIIRNPHYIIPFRDMLAIATRNNLSVDMDVKENLFQLYKNDFRKVIQFIRKNNKPIFMFSYEKAITDKSHFVNELAKFVGTIDQEKINQAIKAIEPNKEEYIKRNVGNSKGNNFIGRFDCIKDNHLIGWAKLTGSNDPIQLALHINSEFLTNFTANDIRPDLKKLKYGQCAFKFDLSPLELDKSKEHRVELFFPNGEKLINSPLYY